jgi:hypothetical protein
MELHLLQLLGSANLGIELHLSGGAAGDFVVELHFW